MTESAVKKRPKLSEIFRSLADPKDVDDVIEVLDDVSKLLYSLWFQNGFNDAGVAAEDVKKCIAVMRDRK